MPPGGPRCLQAAPGGFRQPLTTVCPPGFLEVIAWPLAGRLNVSRSWRPDLGAGQLHYYGQLAALSDCVYHNMYRCRYLGLHDMDELILPQAVDRWGRHSRMVTHTRSHAHAFTLARTRIHACTNTHPNQT